MSRRAIAHNIGVVRRAAPRSKVWVIAKADAYGHGLERVLGRGSPVLDAADGIAILEVETARAVRDLGWSGPILLLEGCFDRDDQLAASQLGLTVVVHRDEQLHWLEIAALPAPLDVYLKMNTGMNRLGFRPPAFAAAHARLAASANVRAITLMSHFANADREGGIDRELATFEAAARDIDAPRSLANSAAILLHPRTHADWVRPGIMLYGATPFASRPAAEFGLRPAMSLQSALISIQAIERGESVGYGSRFTAERAMRIGVVACGYADGYPRVAPNGTPVAVDGRRTRLVGRVSMDMLTVDLSELPHAHVGSAVELWGAAVPVDDVARAAGTVGYELLCALAPRVPVTAVD